MSAPLRYSRATERLSPFDPDDDPVYWRWREAKLAAYPARIDELIVEVADPRSLSNAEHEAILQRCRIANMAIYASRVCEADKDILRLLGRQFGLTRLDRNWLADEDGITQVTVAETGGRQNYIPYTSRPIKWHTDGYYNPPERRIRAMFLHCVSNALAGGENALLDHEIAYLLIRDADADLVRALMATDAMTIPARVDEAGIARVAETGPVFHVDPYSGALHMRYTARSRSIEWKQDAATLSAVAFLENLLAAESPYIYQVRLEPGMGIVSNNILHDRTEFVDGEKCQRLLYRARYYDRIAGTELALGDAAPCVKRHG